MKLNKKGSTCWIEEELWKFVHNLVEGQEPTEFLVEALASRLKKTLGASPQDEKNIENFSNAISNPKMVQEEKAG